MKKKKFLKQKNKSQPHPKTIKNLHKFLISIFFHLKLYSFNGRGNRIDENV